jgi:PPIC-type PPIASE domain.
MFNAKVEEVIYSLPVNEVSMPIRCSDGYHIIQVLNKRPAVGSVDIEQVLFNFSRIPADPNQIDSVGRLLGENIGICVQLQIINRYVMSLLV